jgi:hypothetical protein
MTSTSTGSAGWGVLSISALFRWSSCQNMCCQDILQTAQKSYGLSLHFSS